jgi:hypothetical protein
MAERLDLVRLLMVERFCTVDDGRRFALAHGHLGISGLRWVVIAGTRIR